MPAGSDRLAAIRRHLEDLVGEAGAGDPEAQATLDDLGRDRRFARMIEDILAEAEAALARKPSIGEANAKHASHLAAEPKPVENTAPPADIVSAAAQVQAQDWREAELRRIWKIADVRRDGETEKQFARRRARERVPSAIGRQLCVETGGKGWPAVLAAMRPDESPVQFAQRVRDGHAAATRVRDQFRQEQPGDWAVVSGRSLAGPWAAKAKAEQQRLEHDRWVNTRHRSGNGNVI